MPTIAQCERSHWPIQLVLIKKNHSMISPHYPLPNHTSKASSSLTVPFSPFSLSPGLFPNVTTHLLTSIALIILHCFLEKRNLPKRKSSHRNRHTNDRYGPQQDLHMRLFSAHSLRREERKVGVGIIVITDREGNNSYSRKTRMTLSVLQLGVQYYAQRQDQEGEETDDTDRLFDGLNR